jgi:hypothetical protein
MCPLGCAFSQCFRFRLGSWFRRKFSVRLFMEGMERAVTFLIASNGRKSLGVLGSASSLDVYNYTDEKTKNTLMFLSSRPRFASTYPAGQPPSPKHAIYILAFPRLSKGSIRTSTPAAINSAPET